MSLNLEMFNNFTTKDLFDRVTTYIEERLKKVEEKLENLHMDDLGAKVDVLEKLLRIQMETTRQLETELSKEKTEHQATMKEFLQVKKQLSPLQEHSAMQEQVNKTMEDQENKLNKLYTFVFGHEKDISNHQLVLNLLTNRILFQNL